MANPLDLFLIIAPTLEELEIDYAVGGAVAMSSYGFARHTEDLDVFFRHEDTATFLSALRKEKIRFATIAEPYHYAIIPDVKNPDFRIDLLFTSEDVEHDAVEFPDTASALTTKGDEYKINVFPLELLVTAKARSDRGKDHDDVRRMYARGMFDKEKIVKMLKRYGEPHARKRLERILEKDR